MTEKQITAWRHRMGDTFDGCLHLSTVEIHQDVATKHDVKSGWMPEHHIVMSQITRFKFHLAPYCLAENISITVSFKPARFQFIRTLAQGPIGIVCPRSFLQHRGIY